MRTKSWHNIVLNLDDGVIVYEINTTDINARNESSVASWPHSIINNKELSIVKVDKKMDDEYCHIYLFLGALRDFVEVVEKIDFPLIDYLGMRRLKIY